MRMCPRSAPGHMSRQGVEGVGVGKASPKPAALVPSTPTQPTAGSQTPTSTLPSRTHTSTQRAHVPPHVPPCQPAGADPERVIKEIEEIIGLDCTNILRVSAKMGLGIEETLEAIVDRVPAPTNTVAKPLRALIFDSYYDAYRGVVCQFKVRTAITMMRVLRGLCLWWCARCCARFYVSAASGEGRARKRLPPTRACGCVRARAGARAAAFPACLARIQRTDD